MKWKTKKTITPFLFIAPFFLGLALFWVYPVIHAFYLSLFSQIGLWDRTFVGFKNFLELWQDERFYNR